MSRLSDIEILGGSYGEIRDQDYDTRRFHAHHLISKETWKRVGEQIADDYGITRYNEFITTDMDQEWAPAILMEWEDHEMTRSFFGPHMTRRERELAEDQIDYESEVLFEEGDVMALLNQECADIRRKFGRKYDRAIGQMFGSIKGQFRRQGNVLIIYDMDTGYYVKFRYGLQ